MIAEHDRLAESRAQKVPWKKWGPYLSERQWGTVREDYSDSGNAWDYFSHDQARSRAYRWGEDGLAGVSDDVANRTPYIKDGINNHVVHGQAGAVNADGKGTKVAAHYRITVGSGASEVIRLRLSDVAPGKHSPFGDFDETLELRRNEADEFYGTVIPHALNADEAEVMRQALAGRHGLDVPFL
jgi:hypothetical protein